MSIDDDHGSTKDAVSGAGKYDYATSKGSHAQISRQHVAVPVRPTGNETFGNGKQRTSQQVVETTNRASTLEAGNDLNILRPVPSQK
ncbi:MULTISPECIES: hypothetical protein [Pseudomonas]|uniref:Uncharacterized protein n=1 Tax=Pseudomonas syringae pv. atrofaciens TaxID=192087 RepID=A0AAD0I896_PSESX|nr:MULTISPECIES: hypothetical protein [Pseudomonas]AVX22585.1 hypothetical protein DA456_03785 [Pseudomonas syringae pv. atrofaciens]MBI6562446.1 hypothetical protein [Pseudomonas syringae]MBI6570511.1 hypothetical protein [Pseudomonas syringae]MBI6589758.1 hypothetical protein [Pseudomonas syringae]MBI6595448.1 hypothetical protein [Pseudomonas syringae]